VLRGTEIAARSLGMQVLPIEVRGPGGLDSAFAAISREQATALVVLPDPMFRNQHKRIIELAAQQRLPTMYWSRELVDAGGLMSYGASIPDIHRRAAVFVDKILKGARPGELPVEQPTKFELVINLKAARTLGLTISQSLLQQADQALE
jgi:putative ABC transport system substrate-binding protein